MVTKIFCCFRRLNVLGWLEHREVRVSGLATCLAAPIFLSLLSLPLHAQAPVYTLNGSSTSAVASYIYPVTINNFQQAVTWRLTFTYSGFSAVTVGVVCSTQGVSTLGTWSFMNNPYDATANPATVDTINHSGTVATRAMCPFVGVTAFGTGTGTIVFSLLGYVGSSNSPAEVGAVTTIPGTVNVEVVNSTPIAVSVSNPVTINSSTPVNVDVTTSASCPTPPCAVNVSQWGGSSTSLGQKLASLSVPTVPSFNTSFFNQAAVTTTAGSICSGGQCGLPAQIMCVKALLTNTDYIYVGYLAASTTASFPLAAGEAFCPQVGSTSSIWVVANSGTQNAAWYSW
jgi:hypothetical protein